MKPERGGGRGGEEEMALFPFPPDAHRLPRLS